MMEKHLIQLQNLFTLLGAPKCGKGSAGIGNLSNMPWLDFTLPNNLGAINVAYLFKPNMTGVYLTFRAFFYGALDAKYGKYLPLYLKNKSRHIREFLEESNKLRDDFVFSMDFSENTAVMKKHSAGTIIAKYYEKGNIPSDEELIADLNYFLELYQFVIDNYEDKTDLAVDEWIEVLENEEVIDGKMFSILEIMYNMADYSATTGQISQKRGDLGFDEESYNSLIVSNSRKVKEFLDKKPIFNNDGTENFWTRFFYGKKVDGAFQFKMQDNLVEAFGRVDRIDENKEKSESSDIIDGNQKEEQEYGVDIMSGENNYDSFYDYLIKREYLFDKEIIENYLLSLKVKPFAILTGNSGTGKTKLSQLFAQYISENKKDILVDDGDEGYVIVKAKANYSSWANKGWTLNKEDFKNIIPISECEGTFPLEIDGIEGTGSINLLAQLYYDKNNEELINYFKNLYDKNPNQIVDLKINREAIEEFSSDDYFETNGSIVLKQRSNPSAYDKRQWFMSKELFNYLPFKNGYTDCKIIVNGIESSARIRIVPKLTFKKNSTLQEYLKENDGKEVSVDIKVQNFNFKNFKPKWKYDEYDKYLDLEEVENNYKIIPVGANWTENRHIVGYYNVITNEYQDTPAYKLIEKANSCEEPYFLILDEMNLSHVERYFADFLSAIESGEKIPLYGEEELTLPENLFIIGTVNVDETTYMFSPKVLDRANVIEFETYSASDYMNDNINLSSPSGNIEYLENPLAGNEIRSYGIDELREIFSDVTVDDEPFWDVLSYEINSFQTILSKSGFDFGFRVINEIVRFMAVAWEYEGKPSEFDNWTRYFDACIKQKMLPKLHGSEKIIGETLEELSNLCSDSVIGTEDMVKYPESFKKLEEMKKILRKQRYVSFIN